MLSFSFISLVALWLCLLLKPATKAQSCSNQSQACSPVQCNITSDPSQTCDTELCGAPSCCDDKAGWCNCSAYPQYSSEVQCSIKNGMHKATKTCSFILISNCSCEKNEEYLIYNCSVSLLMTSHSYSAITMSSTSNLITVTTNTRVVVPVIAGVLPVCLLLLIVISSILACTLYRRRANHITERHQIDTQEQLSTLDNLYAHIPAQSTDAVYSRLHEGDIYTTETSHHNTVLPPPIYSSLATTQLQDANEQGIPSAYSVITQENLSNTVGQMQNSVASAGVGAGTVYSTVVRQDGKKVTVKIETPHTHTKEEKEEEEEESSFQTGFDHDHTLSVEFYSNTHATEEEEKGAQDMDYFDDPDILQQIRAQKQ